MKNLDLVVDGMPVHVLCERDMVLTEAELARVEDVVRREMGKSGGRRSAISGQVLPRPARKDTPEVGQAGFPLKDCPETQGQAGNDKEGDCPELKGQAGNDKEGDCRNDKKGVDMDGFYRVTAVKFKRAFRVDLPECVFRFIGDFLEENYFSQPRDERPSTMHGAAQLIANAVRERFCVTMKPAEAAFVIGRINQKRQVSRGDAESAEPPCPAQKMFAQRRKGKERK